MRVRKAKKTRSPTVAERADRTAYDTLINDHLNDNSLPCSKLHKQNGHLIK